MGGQCSIDVGGVTFANLTMFHIIARTFTHCKNVNVLLDQLSALQGRDRKVEEQSLNFAKLKLVS